MILAAVGTYCHGFSDLVEQFDQACHQLDLDGFAQIGHSAFEPRHVAFDRFLPHADLKTMMAHARLVVCHAGMGVVGDAMRAGAPIIMVPRRARLNADEPTNDQLGFAEATAAKYGLGLCLDPLDLQDHIAETLHTPPAARTYPLHSNVGDLVAETLRTTYQA